MTNLRDKDNPDMRRRLLHGLVTPSHVAVMDEAEMASDAMKEKRKEDIRYAIDSRRMDWDKESVCIKHN